MNAMADKGDWAEHEFRTLDLGDKRLDRRLIKVIGDLAASPLESIPTASEGWTETQAAYRLFDNEKVTADKVLRAHSEETIRRMAKTPVALVLQDTTELDYTAKRGKLKDAGPIDYKTRIGLLLHPQIVVTPEGLHLGILDAEMWTRDEEKLGQHRDYAKRDFEEKETRRWRDGYRIASRAAESCPKTQVVSIGDREADIFELLLEAERNSLENMRFVIRARHNRCLSERDAAAGGAVHVKMYDRVARQAPLGRVTIDVPRQKERKARMAELEIRATKLEIKSPHIKNLPNVTVWCVHAKEVDPPSGVDPLEWYLLTDLLCETLAEAVAALQYYAMRWQIEVFFRVLKTGCKVEQLQFERLARLQPCLAVYMIAAWRILNVMMLGRHCPDLPCDILLTEAEWKSAWQVRRQTPPPESPPALGEMISILSSLGGHLGRKCDGLPGPKSIWIGLHRTMEFALAWNAFGPGADTGEP
jgi:hypothetical protein